mmetsp:Transcript_5348/g.19294  ORF Transcript_5348/g.19294 Transcript_5348/m.19294 type:complete len:234 (-) Transcript_5348:253-954(-)
MSVTRVVLLVVVLMRVPPVPDRVRHLRSRAPVRVPPDVREVIVPVRERLRHHRPLAHRSQPRVIRAQAVRVRRYRILQAAVELQHGEAVRPREQRVVHEPWGVTSAVERAAREPVAEARYRLDHLLEPVSLLRLVLANQDVVVPAADALIHDVRGDARFRALVRARRHDGRVAAAHELVDKLDRDERLAHRRSRRLARGDDAGVRRVLDERRDHPERVVLQELRGFVVVPVLV